MSAYSLDLPNMAPTLHFPYKHGAGRRGAGGGGVCALLKMAARRVLPVLLKMAIALPSLQSTSG